MSGPLIWLVAPCAFLQSPAALLGTQAAKVTLEIGLKLLCPPSRSNSDPSNLNSGTINLLGIELGRCFSLPPRKRYISPSPPFVLFYLLPPSSPSLLVRPLSLLSLLPPLSCLTTVTDMNDSPETALYFIFMYVPMTSIATGFA